MSEDKVFIQWKERTRFFDLCWRQRSYFAFLASRRPGAFQECVGG